MLEDRPYIRVTPSNDTLDEAASPPPAAFRSLHSLTGEGSRGFIDSRDPPAVFEVLVMSRGEDAPVELYYGVDTKAHVETVKRNLRDIYPETFKVERVMRAPWKRVLTPVRLSSEEFVDRLRDDDLLVDIDEIAVDSSSPVPDDAKHPTRDVEFVVDGTHVAVSPPSQFEGRDDESLLSLTWPTLAPSGAIYARPAIESVDARGVRWEASAQRKHDWMTCFETTTIGRDTDDVHIDWAQSGTPALQSLITTVGGASVPTAVQLVFEPKDDWTAEAESRKRRIREQRDTITQRVMGTIIPTGDANRSDAEYPDGVRRRLAHLSAKHPKRTFTLNIRATTVPTRPAWEHDDGGTEDFGEIHESERVLDALETSLDAFAGEYIELKSNRIHEESSPTATTLTRRLLGRDLVTAGDDGLANRVLSSSRRRAGIVVNPSELARLATVPSGQNLPVEVSRDARTRKQESVPLPRPLPEHIDPFTGTGMAVGDALDEAGRPCERIQIPEVVLSRHYARFAASGAGKSVGILNDMLTLHSDTSGPVVLMDPKGDGMSQEYLQAHYAAYDTLEDVYAFTIPEDVPAIGFFDIRPALAAGLDRATAIKDVVERFHEVLRVVMGEDYDQAYVATQILGKLVTALFDPEYGQDAYTLDGLLTAVDDMQRSQALPELSAAFVDLEQSLAAHFEKPDRQFLTTMDAARNRLEQLADDPALEAMFNHVPAFDWETGMYAADGIGLDFRRLLDEDVVVLFDMGQLRPKPQRGMTLVLVSELWYRIQLEEQAYGGYTKQTNLIMEEAADVVASDLVTEQLIPKARSFGLSLGLVMQYPSQVREVSERAYQEMMNNVQTRLYGKLANEADVESMLASSRVDPAEVRDRLNAMPRGEWIAELPSPKYGSEHLRPFSLEALDIPSGHSESDTPVDASNPGFANAYDDMTTVVEESLSVSVTRLETEPRDTVTAHTNTSGATESTTGTADATPSESLSPEAEFGTDATDSTDGDEELDEWEEVLAARDRLREQQNREIHPNEETEEPTEDTTSDPLDGPWNDLGSDTDTVNDAGAETDSTPGETDTNRYAVPLDGDDAETTVDENGSKGAPGEDESAAVAVETVEPPASPLPAAYSPKTDEELDELGLTRDDEHFLLLVLRAMNGELEDYDLLESMIDFRGDAGNPDVDMLKEEGYVHQHRVVNKRYYTVLPRGRKHLERTQSVSPGEGDLGEKTPHKVGVELLARAFEKREDIDHVKRYYRASEDVKYDVAGFDANDELVRVGEVETQTNDYDSIANDFEKLKETGMTSVWAVQNGDAGRLVTRILAKRGFIPEIPEYDRAMDLRDDIADRDIDGLQQLETFKHLSSRVDS
ncbi:hypothetical protein [Halorubellus sp. PRR65]|uniref:ATP-binding protein n=1 Tax=Halorubellus sp. PRR65 TaxID=3098148 RepID=UPI002B25C3C7|nr:hypothetical protein [Halorubellus sp. PRR65]